MDKKVRKHKQEYYFGRQCRFQILGRRCQLQIEMCTGTHQLKSRFCEFHRREEYLHECEYLSDPCLD